MKTNFKKMLAVVALVLPIAFTACSDKKEVPVPTPQPIDEMSLVKLSFVADSAAVGTLAADKVDLLKAASVKLAYTVEDGSVQPQAINEAELLVSGDSTKISARDNRTLWFKGGSTLTIHSVTLYNKEGEVMGIAPAPDQFEVSTPKGTKVMERIYPVIRKER